MDLSEEKAKEILMFLAKKNIPTPYVNSYGSFTRSFCISCYSCYTGLSDAHKTKFYWCLDFEDDTGHIVNFPMRIANEKSEFKYPYFIFTKERSYEECLEKIIETVSKIDKKRNIIIDGMCTLARIGTTLEQILIEMDLGNCL